MDTRGAELSRAYYEDVVAPLLSRRFTGLPYTAGRIGTGSDVLGYDDDVSRDHDWGLRLTLLVPTDAAAAVDAVLEAELPASYQGHPTRFAFTGDDASRHRVDVSSSGAFLNERLGFDPRDGMSGERWLSLTGQAALEVLAGPLFADAGSEMSRVRETLRWYPDDVWRHVLATDWARLDEELPLLGRAGSAGDDLGSRVIGARLTHVVMHLCFLIQRRWPPYAKWLGTAFAQLPSADAVGRALSAATAAASWAERQAALADAMDEALRMQNDRGLSSAASATEPFWDRPFRQAAPQIVQQLVEGIGDPDVRRLRLGRGSAEQRTDNVALLVDPAARLRLVVDG